MIEYGRYEYNEIEVREVREYLQDRARVPTTVHYDDVYAIALQHGTYHGPHDTRLWDLLGLISEGEVAAGRYALSAIVTIKNGDGANRPGSGFFELEKQLGRYKVDDDTTWSAEINGLFEYWPEH
jgi:hypothetical protein